MDNQYGSSTEKKNDSFGKKASSAEKDTNSFSSSSVSQDKTAATATQGSAQSPNQSLNQSSNQGAKTGACTTAEITPNQALEYIKENWRVMLSEVVAAGVGAYLKHHKEAQGTKDFKQTKKTETPKQEESFNATH